ncbi:hypothetical protein HDU79_007385 [Rhizoclosmatium sp. JEL0117]|nr:hypothetical protein HDU79_007385 [Rhizoclosmatium sp. JEL0117]
MFTKLFGRFRGRGANKKEDSESALDSSELQTLATSQTQTQAAGEDDRNVGGKRVSRIEGNASHRTTIYLIYYFAFVLLAVPLIKTLGAASDDSASSRLLHPDELSAPANDDWDYIRAEPPVPNDANSALNADAHISRLHIVSSKDWLGARRTATTAMWNKASLLPMSDAALLSDNIWNLFSAPVACDLNHLKSVGGPPHDDGSYWVCTEFLQVSKGCTIFSIGSRGMYEWEKEMLELTERKCIIHTFDCTGYWVSPDPDIIFHQWCLGNDRVVDNQIFKSWNVILEELNITHVDYLKLDIEGGEWIVFPQLLRTGNKLPRQISTEFHRGWQPEGTINNLARVNTDNGPDNLHPLLNLMGLFYSFGYENMIKKTWGPNFEIFTFVLHPSVGPDASNLPSQPSDASSAAEAALAAVTYKSPQNQDTLWNIFKSYNWDAVRSHEAQHFWGLLSILTPLDLSTLPPTKVVGGLPFEEDTTYVCTEKLNITEGSGCTILSVGSRGLGSWETDMLETTKGNCKIHAFDCTGNYQTPHENITFHKWCLGNDETIEFKTYKSWGTTLKELGLTQVDYMKVDIEGWEWNLIPQILADTNQVLPLQISVEFHTGFQPADATNPHFTRNMTENGYYDNATPMLCMMQSIYARGYHVAARKNRFVENEVYTLVLDTEAGDPTGSERVEQRDEKRVTYNTEWLHKVSTHDWAVKWTQLATNFWENIVGNINSTLMADGKYQVHSIGIPETYECDRNYLRHIGSVIAGQDGYWVCTEFLQAPDCRNDIKTVDNFWSCKEFFTPKKDCVILSVGSRGEWGFEENMIQLTDGKCKIYTLDCTGSWTPPHPLITFKQWCLGNDEIIEGRRYKSWNNILSSLGLKHVDYLKMDIEGWEWVVLPHILQTATILPNMISFEIHMDWQQQGTLSAYKPVETENGKDHMRPVMNLFKLFYASGFRTASRKAWGHNCEVFTMVKPDRSINNGLGIGGSDTQIGKNVKPTMYALSTESAKAIVQEVQTKNWNQERKAEVLEFWDFATQLPESYAARLTNKQIFNVFPISYECESTWFRAIGGDPKSPGSHWACVDNLRSAPTCNIVSLGATSNFQWETDLLALNDKCQIHTLDCEMDLISPHPNVKFHKICIGTKDEVIDGKKYQTWASALSNLRVKQIEYLRINLKGWEWAILPQILPGKEESVASVIPGQISVVLNLSATLRPAEYTPKTTPYGKDELHPMLTMFKLFYSYGFETVAKKLHDCYEDACQEFTLAIL